MSKSKTQVSVKVHQDVKEGMDDYADEQNLNRSQTVEEIYHQWGTLTNYGETHPDLITEQLNKDTLDERPESKVAGLLWDARRDMHTFVLIMVVAAGLALLTTGLASLAFGVVATFYALTVVVGAADSLLLNDRLKHRLMDVSDRPTAEVEA